MKDFILKNWKYFVILPVLIAVIIGIVLVVPKGTERLTVSAEDVEVEVGSKVEVPYTVNIEKATCTFSVADEEKVVVDENGVLYGRSVGETEIIVIATYGNEISEATATVTVGGGVNSSEDTTESYEYAITYSNGEVIENEIEMQAGKILWINIQISPMKEEDVKVESKDIEVKKFQEVSGLYELKCEEKGEYTITITSSIGIKNIKVNVI